MIIRSLVRRFFSTNFSPLNTIMKGYFEDRKKGAPEIKAFESRLEEVHKLSEKEVDAFYCACITMARASTIPFFLKSQGLLGRFPALHIVCNTHHIIPTLKQFDQKFKLLDQSRKLLAEIKDPERRFSSEYFVEEGYGNVYLQEKKYTEAVDHYLRALEVGNRHFDSAKKQADSRELEITSNKDENKHNPYLVVAVGIAQNLAQTSTKALYASNKLKNHSELDQEILKRGLYTFNQLEFLKFQQPQYFLLKKTEFNHRVISKKQTGDQIKSDILSTMDSVLHCLQAIGQSHPMGQLQLVGVAAINYSIVLNFLNGTKGVQAQNSIKEVISTLASVIKNEKRRDEFGEVLLKTAREMRAIQ